MSDSCVVMRSLYDQSWILRYFKGSELKALVVVTRLPCVMFFPSRSSSAAGLRTPLAVPGPYPGAFGMLPHPAGMNGELAGAAGAAAYAAGLHNMSPQMSAAAAAAVAAYGRSPMVSGKGDSCFGKVIFPVCMYSSVASLI